MTMVQAYLLGMYIVGFISGAGSALILAAGIYKIIKAGKAARDE